MCILPNQTIKFKKFYFDKSKSTTKIITNKIRKAI
jgi:hypothetical protein